jgi:hypothetical protein
MRQQETNLSLSSQTTTLIDAKEHYKQKSVSIMRQHSIIYLFVFFLFVLSLSDSFVWIGIKFVFPLL